MNLTEKLAKEYDIPFIKDNCNIWFFRTNGGMYYHDFKVNNYIALGWDKLPSSLFMNNKAFRELKKEEVAKIYPDEKRPGLIVSQMEIFYNAMKEGDIVAIPSIGSKSLSIGYVGPIELKEQHIKESEEYIICKYQHQRTVEWIKTVEISRDLYLQKTLRSQQTIANLSQNGDLILRNLFPYYIADDGAHITFQKVSSGDFQLFQSLQLETELLNLFEEIAVLYGKEHLHEAIHKKTAVGSPGFLELILPYSPISVIYLVAFVYLVLGVEKSDTGQVSIGLLSIVSKINNLINDHYKRKKMMAETALIEAQVDKTRAETEQIKTKTSQMTGKQIMLMSDGKTTVEYEEENEQLQLPQSTVLDNSVNAIIESGQKIKKITSINGIEIERDS